MASVPGRHSRAPKRKHIMNSCRRPCCLLFPEIVDCVFSNKEETKTTLLVLRLLVLVVLLQHVDRKKSTNVPGIFLYE
jgi:hypothetical protein